MRHARLLAAGTALLAATVLAGCGSALADLAGDDRHPRLPHSLLPEFGPDGGQIASGVVTGESPDQPIAFTHKRHVTLLGLDCQYCHASARRSRHAGVPETAVCMGCHKYVRTDAPEIQRLTAYWNAGQPIPWSRVHDLPDYVHFEHKRHVRGGVECSECHGQVGLMEGVRVTIGHGEGDEHSFVQGTMVRESTLQMGWCLGCHGTHPAIDQNYGDQANLRRAELKDCWTCHK